MMNQDDREIAFAAKQARELQEEREKWRVLDYLAAGADLSVSVCKHAGETSNPAPQGYFSATVAQESGLGLTVKSVYDMVRCARDTGEIRTVPHWKAPRLQSVWAPSPCNSARRDPSAEALVGSSQIGLFASGSPHFHDRQICYWGQLPDAGKEYVKVMLKVDRLPLSWEAQPQFTGFSRVDGTCTKMFLAQPAGLASARVTAGRAGGSWRLECFWDTVDDFIEHLTKSVAPVTLM